MGLPDGLRLGTHCTLTNEEIPSWSSDLLEERAVPFLPLHERYGSLLELVEREASGKTTRLSSEEVAIARADRTAIMAALREGEAWRTKMAADWEHEDRLRAEVRAKNEVARTMFERDALSEAAAGQVLGFGVLERGRRLRELVQSGLLRQVQPPPMLVLKGGFGDPLRVEEGCPMSIHGAPFFLRADVLAVRQETAEIAAHAVAHGPDREAVHVEAVAEILRAFLASRGR